MCNGDVQNDKKSSQQRLRGTRPRRPSDAPPVLSQERAALTDTHTLDASALRRRAACEAEHAGNFERIFPPAQDTQHSAAAAVLYAECLAAAEACFEQHHAKRNRNLLDSLAAKHRQQRVRLPAFTPPLYIAKVQPRNHWFSGPGLTCSWEDCSNHTSNKWNEVLTCCLSPYCALQSAGG
jgi:hypothetical protein